MPSPSHTTFPRPARNVEVAPGVRILPVDLGKIPAIAVCEAVRKRVTFEDGRTGYAYIYIERIHDAWLRISEAEKLNLGLSEEVIVKLIKAGFVEGGRAAPNSKTVNVVSLLEHIEETREDPDFWTPERKQRYREQDSRYGEN